MINSVTISLEEYERLKQIEKNKDKNYKIVYSYCKKNTDYYSDKEFENELMNDIIEYNKTLQNDFLGCEDELHRAKHEINRLELELYSFKNQNLKPTFLEKLFNI